MNILVLSNMYPSDSHKYFGIYVKNFIDSFERSGINVIPVVIKGRSVKKRRKIFEYVKYLFKSLSCIIFKDYDIIYVHGASLALLPVSVWSFLIRKPIVINAHGTDLLGDGFLNKVVFNFNYSSIRKSSLMVFPSLAYYHLVKKKLPSVRSFISPSGGIDRSVFKPGHFNVNNKEFVIGCVTRLDPDKGWDVFLRSIYLVRSQHPSIKLRAVIAGSGSENMKMHKLIEEYNINNCVEFVGQLSHGDLSLLYKSMDLFVFPTLLNESLGLVGLEAMACGVPVVASDIGGIRDYIINDENGFLCKPGDSCAFAKSICKYVGLSSYKKEKIISRCLETAHDFDSDVVNEKLANRLKMVIDNYDA